MKHGILIGLTPLLLAACDPGCGNTILQDIPSPDGLQHAVIFSRDCGATTDFSTQVSILGRTQPVSGAGNVFIIVDGQAVAPRDSAATSDIVATWIDSRTLEIQYDSRGQIFQQRGRHNDTVVRYATRGSTSHP